MKYILNWNDEYLSMALIAGPVDEETSKSMLKEIVLKRLVELNVADDQEDAQEMCSWEYSGQYRVYNNSWEKMAEQGISYADEETRRKEFYTLLRDGKMIGFFRLRRGEKVVELGLGLRPDLCGQGLGKKLVQAAVQEHKKRFGDLPLWLAVRVWNERAINCYRTCGFVEIKRLTLELSEGPTEFIRMEYRDDEKVERNCKASGSVVQ